MEKFKKSTKSICHGCNNINEVCSIKTFKTCGTDSKIGFSFVEKCNMFNKDFNEKKVTKKVYVTAGHKPETRSENIGGKV